MKKIIFLLVSLMLFIPHINAKEYKNEQLIIDDDIIIFEVMSPAEEEQVKKEVA